MILMHFLYVNDSILKTLQNVYALLQNIMTEIRQYNDKKI